MRYGTLHGYIIRGNIGGDINLRPDGTMYMCGKGSHYFMVLVPVAGYLLIRENLGLVRYNVVACETNDLGALFNSFVSRGVLQYYHEYRNRMIR